MTAEHRAELLGIDKSKNIVIKIPRSSIILAPAPTGPTALPLRVVSQAVIFGRPGTLVPIQYLGGTQHSQSRVTVGPITIWNSETGEILYHGYGY